MRFAWLAPLCLLMASQVDARPYDVEDLLSLEDYGRALFSPAGDAMVIERLAGQKSAARFDFDYFVRRARSRVMVASVAGAGGLVPLFPQTPDAGYWIGGFSPSGRRLVVYRLQRDRITLGIVDMASRRVRWLAVTPDQPAGQVNPAWIDDDHLVLVALAKGDLPYALDFGGRVQKRLPELWARTARGRLPAVSVVGSGSDLQAGVARTENSLLAIDLVRNAVRTLAKGDFIDLALSPDGRHIALIERDSAVPAPPVDTAFSLDFQSRRFRLRLVGLDGVEASPCPACDVAPDLLDWTRDGSRLMFLARHDDQSWDGARLYSTTTAAGAPEAVPLDTAGVRPTMISTTPGRATVRAGWWGNLPLVYGNAGTGRDDWFLIERGSLRRMTGDIPEGAATSMRIGRTGLCAATAKGLWSIDGTGSARPVGTAPGLAIVSDAVGAFDIGTRPFFAQVRDTPVLWLKHDDAKVADLLAVDCDGAKSVSAGHAAAGTRMLAVAPAHGVGVGLALSPRGEGRLFMIGRGGRLLDRINDGLATLDSPEPVALHRVAPHGGEVDWLLLPPGRDPRDALPLIVMPYPGAEFDATMPRMFGPADFQPMLSPALLAAHGFAVLAPSMPVGDKEPVADIIAALRPAIAAAIATGRIDPARIGVLGHSYGGYTALVMATELPCLRSAVASAADADLLMSYGAFDPRLKVDFKEGLPTTYPFAWAEQGQGRMGGLPWRDPDRYIRNSPFYRLDKVVAPILLLHGDLDPISVMQAERTYAALYRLGKDARLVRFFGDAHVPASPANIRVRWRETFAWLDRTMTQPRTGGSIFDAAGRCTSPSRP